MTLTDLRYLAALADHGHFGRAAAACRVSQSTLSMAIRRLEKNLGITLFERARSGITATADGEKVLTHARRALAHAQAITTLASHSDNPLAEPLTLGAPCTIAPYFYPLLLPHLRQLTGDPQVYLEEEDEQTLITKLTDGCLDALMVTVPFQHPDVVTRTLFNEPLVVILPTRHPLAAQQWVDPASLSEENLLLPDASADIRECLLTACPILSEHLKNDTARPLTRGSTLETLRHMVACGLGVAVVPMSAVSPTIHAPGTVFRPFAAPGVHRTLGLAWRASFPRHGAVDSLIDALQACNPAYWLNTDEAPSSVLVENQCW